MNDNNRVGDDGEKNNDSNRGKGVYEYNIKNNKKEIFTIVRKHFANILRLHFNYTGTVLKTIRMIYLGNNCNCI